LQLPPRAPELNGQENIWQFMRQNWLSNRIFKSFDDIVDHCCYAWNKLVAVEIMSIAPRLGNGYAASRTLLIAASAASVSRRRKPPRSTNVFGSSPTGSQASSAIRSLAKLKTIEKADEKGPARSVVAHM
jgi:hypothetical protein